MTDAGSSTPATRERPVLHVARTVSRERIDLEYLPEVYGTWSTPVDASPLRVAGRASRARRALLQISIACAACSPEQLDREGADAEVYIRAFCEDGCSKWEECAPLPSGTEDCSVEECIEQVFSPDEIDRPCFEPKLEYSRCRIERESCEEYFAMGIQTGPETACYDILVVAQTCIERYSDPG